MNAFVLGDALASPGTRVHEAHGADALGRPLSRRVLEQLEVRGRRGSERGEHGPVGGKVAGVVVDKSCVDALTDPF